MKTWNERFALAVAQSDYNREQIAKQVGASPPTVAAWIGAGNIRPAQNITGENLLKVCRLLDIRPAWLMFGEGAMRPSKSAKISPEMAQVLALLVDIDAKGGTEREDALYFLNRLLAREGNMSVKQA